MKALYTQLVLDIKNIWCEFLLQNARSLNVALSSEQIKTLQLQVEEDYSAKAGLLKSPDATSSRSAFSLDSLSLVDDNTVQLELELSKLEKSISRAADKELNLLAKAFAVLLEKPVEISNLPTPVSSITKMVKFLCEEAKLDIGEQTSLLESSAEKLLSSTIAIYQSILSKLAVHGIPAKSQTVVERVGVDDGGGQASFLASNTPLGQLGKIILENVFPQALSQVDNFDAEQATKTLLEIMKKDSVTDEAESFKFLQSFPADLAVRIYSMIQVFHVLGKSLVFDINAKKVFSSLCPFYVRYAALKPGIFQNTEDPALVLIRAYCASLLSITDDIPIAHPTFEGIRENAQSLIKKELPSDLQFKQMQSNVQRILAFQNEVLVQHGLVFGSVLDKLDAREEALSKANAALSDLLKKAPASHSVTQFLCNYWLHVLARTPFESEPELVEKSAWGQTLKVARQLIAISRGSVTDHSVLEKANSLLGARLRTGLDLLKLSERKLEKALKLIQEIFEHARAGQFSSHLVSTPSIEPQFRPYPEQMLLKLYLHSGWSGPVPEGVSSVVDSIKPGYCLQIQLGEERLPYRGIVQKIGRTGQLYLLTQFSNESGFALTRRALEFAVSKSQVTIVNPNEVFSNAISEAVAQYA